MENASNALIIAGGVLIGILIISLAMYLFVDFGSTSAQIHAQNDLKQINQFNTKFTAYVGNNDITIYDIISVAEYAAENNAYYSDSLGENGVTVCISNQPIQGTMNKENLIATYVKNNGDFIPFSCSDADISYHDNGRVQRINFRPH